MLNADYAYVINVCVCLSMRLSVSVRLVRAFDGIRIMRHGVSLSQLQVGNRTMPGGQRDS